jgi:hypothetical protein
LWDHALRLHDRFGSSVAALIAVEMNALISAAGPAPVAARSAYGRVTGHGARRGHCLAGLGGLELRNPCEGHVFEMS